MCTFQSNKIQNIVIEQRRVVSLICRWTMNTHICTFLWKLKLYHFHFQCINHDFLTLNFETWGKKQGKGSFFIWFWKWKCIYHITVNILNTHRVVCISMLFEFILDYLNKLIVHKYLTHNKYFLTDSSLLIGNNIGR